MGLWKTINNKIFDKKEVNIHVNKEQELLWAWSWQANPRNRLLNDLVSMHSNSRLRTSIGGFDIALPVSLLHNLMNY